jgi:hypothetical protein
MLYEFLLIVGYTVVRTIAQYFFKLAATTHNLAHISAGIALYAGVGYFIWEIIRVTNSLILAVVANNISNIFSILMQRLVFGTILTYKQIVGSIFVLVGGYLL